MMIELTLNSIECIKQNESGKDEIYLEFKVRENKEGGIEDVERYPNNEAELWEFTKGDKKELNQALFVGNIGFGLEFQLAFYEEDMSAGSRLVTPAIIKNMVDDFIGEINISLHNMHDLKYEVGKHTKHKGSEGKKHEFSLTGGGAEYHVVLELKHL